MNHIVEKTVISYYNALNESRADKLAIRFLKSKGIDGYEKQMQIIGKLKHDIPNIREEHGKFVLGGLRCFFDHQLSGEQEISAFDKALGYIFKGGHHEDYDENLNGLSVDELTDMFKEDIKYDLDYDIERSNNRIFDEPSDYTVIPINDYNDAKQYGKYTSWCVTHGKQYYTSYINKGTKRFYFCLKKGFENIKKKKGPDAPLDEYGLSMISVLIDNTDGGSVNRVTTRWNHEHNGENNKNLCTAEQIENIIKLPFYKTFKPYTKEELHDKGIVTLDEVQGMLDNGVQPKQIFDIVNKAYEGVRVVTLHGKANFLTKNKKLLFTKWYDGLNSFYNGLARVNKNGMYNFIDKDEKLLFKNWYKNLGFWFINNIVSVTNDKGYDNYIDKNEHIVFNKWYDSMGSCIIGNRWIKVCELGNINYIDIDNNYLTDEWYSDYEYFDDVSVFKVSKKDSKNGNERGYVQNLVDLDGNILFDEWYERIDINGDKNKVKVKKNDQYTYRSYDDKPLCDEYYDSVRPIGKDYTVVSKMIDGHNKVTLLGPKGNRINDGWYDNINWSRDDNFLTIRDKGKINMMDTSGKIRFDKWFDDIRPSLSNNNLTMVRLDKKWAFIDNSGKLLFNDWYDGCKDFINGFAVIQKNNEYNYIDKSGKLLSNQWFGHALSFVLNDKYTIVNVSDKPGKFQDKNVQHIFEYCDCEEDHIIRTMCDKDRNDMFLGSFLANSFFENSLKRRLADIAYDLKYVDVDTYIIDNTGQLYQYDEYVLTRTNYDFESYKIKINL